MKRLAGLTLTGGLLTGCALYSHDPTPDLIGAWHLESILKRPVIDYSPAYMQFGDNGQVSGDASCNRFTGQYRLEGESLSFGNIAMTRKLCPEALMAQEDRFAQALEAITRAEIHQGMLVLKNAIGETVIKAAPKP